VWTGRELVVCCGHRTPGEKSHASAAAFDPATDRWRTLATPPEDAARRTFGSAWTGSHFLVLVVGMRSANEVGSTTLLAYDVAADRWERRSDAPAGGLSSDAIWTGDRLVVWTSGFGGATYNPAADWWTPLPPVPADHQLYDGSVAWVDDQLVVWGSDRGDDTRAVGYRLSLDEPAFSTGWRPMADAPIPPIASSEGTPGSQTVLVDEEGGRLIVYPVQGQDENTGPPSLLSYDPDTDRWRDLGIRVPDWSPETVLVGDLLLQPDRANPVAARLPG
jgi:hypothetical protein